MKLDEVKKGGFKVFQDTRKTRTLECNKNFFPNNCMMDMSNPTNKVERKIKVHCIMYRFHKFIFTKVP